MPNTSTADWRKIETALCKVLHDYGFSIIASHEVRRQLRRRYARLASGAGDDFNLTDFAKDLAEELAP